MRCSYRAEIQRLAAECTLRNLNSSVWAISSQFVTYAEIYKIHTDQRVRSVEEAASDHR